MYTPGHFDPLEVPPVDKMNLLWENDDDFNTRVEALEADAFGATPIGGVIMYFSDGGSAPTGWHYMDGTTVSDGDSPLNGQLLPNIMGNKFVRGVGNANLRTTPNTGGVDTHTHTTPAHGHIWGLTNGSGDLTDGNSQAVHGNNQTNITSGTAFALQDAINATFRTDTSGSGTTGSTSNVPAYIGMTYIIRIK